MATNLYFLGLFSNLTNSTIVGFFATIDKSLFGAIASVYNFIFSSLLNVQILNPGEIRVISNRIYAILGIVILFFVSYKLIMYIISPDMFSDKSKGMGKLISRIFTGILLTLLIPYFFDFGRIIQTEVVSSNIIGNIVVGAQSNEIGSRKTMIDDLENGVYGKIGQDYIKGDLKTSDYDFGGDLAEFTGDSVKGGILGVLFGSAAGAAFGAGVGIAFCLTPGIGWAACGSAVALGAGSFLKFGALAGGSIGVTVGGATSLLKTSVDYIVAVAKNEKIEEALENKIAELQKIDPNEETPGIDPAGETFAKGLWASFIEPPEEYADVNEQAQFRSFIQYVYPMELIPKLIVYKDDNNGWGYMTFTATIGALIALALLILLVFDLILRSFKLIVLQILAPLFVGLYIIGDDSKLNNWLKLTLSTYCLLFFKLFLISFIMYLMPILVRQWAGSGWLIYILIITALLYFVQIAPKFIAKMLGIDESLFSGDGLKMIKGATKALVKTAGVATGLAVGGAAGVMAFQGGAGVGGVLKAAASAGSAGVKGGGPMKAWEAGKGAAAKSLEKTYGKAEAKALGKPVAGSFSEMRKKGQDSLETQQYNKANAVEIKRMEEEKKANERMDTDIMNRVRNAAMGVPGATPTIAVPFNKVSGVIENLRKQGLNNEQISEYFNGNQVIIPKTVHDANGKVDDKNDRIFHYETDNKFAVAERTKINVDREVNQQHLDAKAGELTSAQTTFNVNNNSSLNSLATHHATSLSEITQLLTQRYETSRLASDSGHSLNSSAFGDLKSAIDSVGVDTSAEIKSLSDKVKEGSIKPEDLSDLQKNAVAAWDNYVKTNGDVNLDTVLDLQHNYEKSLASNVNLDADITDLLEKNTTSAAQILRTDLERVYNVEQDIKQLSTEKNAINKRELDNKPRLERTGK